MDGRLSAIAAADLLETRLKNPCSHDHELVARFEQVGQAGFHPGHARAADGQSQSILRL